MGRGRRLLGAAACALGAGCGAPDPIIVDPVRSTLHLDVHEAFAARARLVPLELPSPVDPPAPWVAPALADAEPDPFEQVEAGPRGVEAAIAITKAGRFALDRRAGIVGPLRAPGEIRWMALDGLDRVIAAASDGALHRAPSLGAAARGEFERVGAVPGAMAWDASTRWIAASTGARVLLSGDGGRSFRDLGPGAGAEIDRHFVRSDGVVVAQGRARAGGDEVTWIAAPGRTLRLAPGPPHELSRWGDWIGIADCGVALARDGVRWASVGRWPDAIAREEWIAALSTSDRLEAFTRDFRGAIADPGMPAPPPDGRVPWAGGCSHRVRPPRVRMGHTVDSGYHCVGAAYIGGVTEPAPAYRVELALFRDGRCAPGDEDPDRPGEGVCRAAAPLVRPPSVAIVDRAAGRAAVGAIPPGCRPERLLSAGGAGLLVCAPEPGSSGAPIHLAGEAGTWSAEGTLPMAPGEELRLAAAPDGTLLLRAGWSHVAERRAFVRRPRPFGDRGAWRVVDVRDAIEVRVDVGGALLLLGASTQAAVPSWISIARDTPGKPRQRIVGRAPVEGSVVDAAIEGRSVVLWISDQLLASHCPMSTGPGDRVAATRWVVTRGGTLIRAEPRLRDFGF